jgi:3-oxoacyl-[acyl-carrier-protein] synthase II
MQNGANGAKKRVVITGTGMITPLGHNVTDTWAQLKAGNPALDRLR